jgi:spermidine synthase
MHTRTDAPAGGALRRDGPVYALFIASGAAALVYQVIWLRWLGLVFGYTTVSVSIVLASFMGGLALGSWAAGRAMPYIRNPMRAYAWAEIGIGVFAALFPLLAAVVQGAYLHLATPDTPVGHSLALRAALALALLLVPTSLMGATLPLLAEHFRNSPRWSRTWKAGMLYAANTLGAAAGVLVSGFVLIELLGVRASSLVAAGLNFGVALIALRLGRERTAAVAAAVPADAGGARRRERFALVALALGGAAALASEVLWTRALEVLLGSSTYAFSTIVLTYLLGIAGGSAIGARLAPRIGALERALVLPLAAMSAWTLCSIGLVDALRELVAGNYGRPVTPAALLWQYFKASSILLPLALFSGAMFPLATRLLEDPARPQATGRHIARASAWNTVGSVAGSLGAGFGVAPRLDFFEAVALVAAFYAVAALLLFAWLWARSQPADTGRVPLAACGVAAATLALLALRDAGGASSFLERLRRDHPDLRIEYHRPGLQGVTTVLRDTRDDSQVLLVNGQGMTRKGTDLKVMAHLPMLLHPDPADTLVICFGMGTTYRAALSHGGRVTVVELVGEVLDAFDRFYPDAARTRADPHGRMRVNDGRNFLLLSRESFDVITLDPPPPVNAAGVNNLYSRDFIALARSRLRDGGILAHWIPYPGTQAGVDNAETLGMLFRTFAEVFPYALAMPSLNGGGFHLLGSDRPLSLDAARLRARRAAPAVAADMAGIPEDFTRNLGPWNGSTFTLTGTAGMPPIHFDPRRPYPPVTDDRPRLEFALAGDWLAGRSRYYPLLAW